MGIPKKPRPRRRAHLDTVILRAALGAEVDVDLKKAGKELLHSGKQLAACASLPVLGELALTLSRDFNRKEFGKWMDLLQQHIEKGRLVCSGSGNPDGTTAARTMQLMADDPLLDSTDAWIVACALEDAQADILYTADRQVLTSHVVREASRKAKTKIKPLI